MTCHFPECPNDVAATDMTRCPEHRLRWAPSQQVERPTEPEWLRRAKEKKYGLARPLDRSVA